MKSFVAYLALAALLAGQSMMAVRAGEPEPYLQFQQQWAEAQYQLQGDAQEQALATLADTVRASSAKHPDDLAL